jgi:hypothetical protein
MFCPPPHSVKIEYLPAEKCLSVSWQYDYPREVLWFEVGIEVLGKESEIWTKLTWIDICPRKREHKFSKFCPVSGWTYRAFVYAQCRNCRYSNEAYSDGVEIP